MEVKLMVLTHRPGFGSIPYFSDTMKETDREILEQVKYKEYESNDMEVMSILQEENMIFFMTYVGGKDERGREYRNVIATIFPFDLTDEEKEKLKKIFFTVKEDILDINKFLEKSYFEEIKGKKVKKMKNHGEKKSSSKSVIIFFIVMLLVVVAATGYFLFLKK